MEGQVRALIIQRSNQSLKVVTTDCRTGKETKQTNPNPKNNWLVWQELLLGNITREFLNLKITLPSLPLECDSHTD